MSYASSMVEDFDHLTYLRTRLHRAKGELSEIDERRPKLVKLIETYEALIAQEQSIRADQEIDESTVPAFHPTNDNRSLADLIIRVLGTGPKTLEELKEVGIASGWAPIRDSNFPGRAINFALVGLQKGGYVERKDKLWKLAPVRAAREVVS